MSQRNTRINRGQISSIDVDDLWATNSPTDTQVPSYDLATGKFKWINIGGIASNIDTDESGVSVQDSLDLKLEDAPSDDTIYGRQNGSWVEVSGGGASQLSDLSDVGVTTPTNRNALMADGDSWESRALVEADISDLGNYIEDLTGFDTDDLAEGDTNKYFFDHDNDNHLVDYVPGDGSVNPTNLVSNGDFELWSAGTSTAPDGWALAGAGASVAREGTTIKIGTYSAALTRNGANAFIYTTAHADKGINYWKGRTATLSCWVYATVADRAIIVLQDGVGSASSSYHTGDSTWQLLSVTAVVNATASSVGAYLQVEGGDTTAYFDGAMLVEGSMPFAFSPKPLPETNPTVQGLLTLNGGQIKFPTTQVPSADPNTLDDYEEGSFDVAFVAGTSGTITINSDRKTLYYTKVGRKIHILGWISVTSVDSPVGELSVANLPFVPGTAARSTGAITAYGLEATAITFIMCRIVIGVTAILINKYAAGSLGSLAGDVKAGSEFYFDITYLV